MLQFCFFTSAKSAEFIESCYYDGPSNEYNADEGPINPP